MKKIFLTICLFVLIISCKKKDEVLSIETSQVSDIEGNTYKTVKIGDQWWMAENLRTKRYNDSSLINQFVLGQKDSLWKNTSEGFFNTVDSINGNLYNWMAVNSSKKIAPKGWHIPSDDEWKKLEKTIGMNDAELSKTAWRGSNQASLLMANASYGWASEVLKYVYGTDDFGFRALGSGCVVFDGSVNSTKTTAFWWTSTSQGKEAWYRYIDGQKNQVFRQHTYQTYGFSVRCVKD